MKDLTDNSFFRFNNMFAFDEFNQNENQNENNDEKNSENKEEKQEISDINAPSPEIKISKERKVLTNWLDAEYNSSFQYKKVNTVPITDTYKQNKFYKELDIDDPVIIYDYLKKYTNFLYDYDCPKDIENIIVRALENELKEYYKLHSTEGLDKHLNNQFIKLKNKYLLTINKTTTLPNIPKSKITYSTEELINKLES